MNRQNAAVFDLNRLILHRFWDQLALVLILFVLTFLCFPRIAYSMDDQAALSTPNAQSLSTSTQNLANLLAQHKAGNNKLAELQAEAANQKALFLRLLLEEKNPKAALAYSAANLSGAMPEGVTIPKPYSGKGKLAVLHVDDANPHYEFYIRIPANGNQRAQKIQLHFTKTPNMAAMKSGREATVEGVRLGKHMVLAFNGVTFTSLGSTSPPSKGPWQILFVNINFTTGTQNYYPLSKEPALFKQLTAFFDENSHHAVAAHFTATPYITFHTVNPKNCATLEANMDAEGPALLGKMYNLNNYDAVVFNFPYAPCLGWGGQGWVGAGGPGTHDGNGYIPSVWINGNPQVSYHELGHNLGLYHAHALPCALGQLDCLAWPKNMEQNTPVEYGDVTDSMGNRHIGADYNAFHQINLGWLNTGNSPTEPPAVLVTTAGSYSLSPFESQDNNPKALVIPAGMGPDTSDSNALPYAYVLEYRQPVGDDSIFKSFPFANNEVVVHEASFDDWNSSNLINVNTATDPSRNHTGIAVGQSVTFADSGVTIGVTKATATGATVSVKFGKAAANCVQVNPTVNTTTFFPQWTDPGHAITYTVNVTSKSAGCGSVANNLATTLPGGWTSSFNPPTLMLNDGASGSSTLTVNVPKSATQGHYNITIKANGGQSVNTVNVVNGLNVTLAEITSGSTGYMSAVVTAMGTPLTFSGVPVTVNFTLTLPDGSKLTHQQTADTFGSASWSTPLTQRGSYSIAADAVATFKNAQQVFGISTKSFVY